MAGMLRGTGWVRARVEVHSRDDPPATPVACSLLAQLLLTAATAGSPLSGPTEHLSQISQLDHQIHSHESCRCSHIAGAVCGRSTSELEEAFSEFDEEGRGQIPVAKLRSVLTQIGDRLNGNYRGFNWV